MDTDRDDVMDSEPPPLVRRRLLGSLAVAVPAVAAGWAVAGRDRRPAARAPETVAGTTWAAAAAAVPPEGPRQAGVDRPAQPQQNATLAVFDLPPPDGAAARNSGERPFLARLLSDLGRRITALCSDTGPELGGLVPGDLSVTVGVGPRLVASVDGRLPGAAGLPEDLERAVPDHARQGDLMVQLCAADPQVVAHAERVLTGWLGERSARARWSQGGFRPPAREPGPVRNLLGFLDGVSVPRTERELAREVWLAGPERVRGATIAVVRRLRLDVAGFLAQDVTGQERVIGRQRSDAAPLSGGGPAAAVDLGAKTADGRYLVPLMSHVRRAHPAATGSGLMLRRGYSFSNGTGDQGLLFIAFQRDLRTYVETQRRLDDGDELSAFATATASGTFLVLPGFSAGRPLGSSVFA
ncbi:Dyp-type peroxidase [Streptomyces sp. NBC_01205]|uniref:Dyp-type peroxidase n=1 Tax=Streptomyces sp. NBC_01205 TaxID=2903771 RepID=UPI002E0EB99A|nr:Dyp-type peroxidase [Streptomyces sp. NBC_01205]